MKGKVTAEIMGILPVPIKDTAIINFGKNSNVFGRIYDARKYFIKKYNIKSEQLKIIKCEFLRKGVKK